jgi:phosphopantothenoylcysteine decarboxylase/phosphopantothenate--cysteine ligase
VDLATRPGGSPFAGATVVLGVSGGIAAYKAVEVCRRLFDAGAHVVPVLTEDAQRFVGVTTFSALASERARTQLFEDPADPIPHTALGRRADVVVVAPATARVIGAYAAGISSDLLTAVLLATRAPVVVCPAMHAEMWEHAAVQENVAMLVRRGVTVVPPEQGRLAGGDEGTGRLAEPATILAAVGEVLDRRQGPRDLAGRRVLVTAGGTREPIDPVRFVGNRSSGKQGHALAEAAVARGAAVTLVTAADAPVPAGATVVAVETAAEMEAVVLAEAPAADVVVMAAAVADFRPKAAADQKIRKSAGVPEIVLEPTPDILAELGRARRPGQILVGFAAETEEAEARAAEKLAAKRVDLVVVNDVTAPGAGFGHDTNAVSIVAREGTTRVPLAAKRAVADAVLDAVVRALAETSPAGRDPAPELRQEDAT